MSARKGRERQQTDGGDALRQSNPFGALEGGASASGSAPAHLPGASDSQRRSEQTRTRSGDLPLSRRRWHIRMEKKGRGGKTVTVLAPKEPGFAGQADRARILEQLKTRLGSGGSLQPDGSLLLQGDVRQRLDDQGLITN